MNTTYLLNRFETLLDPDQDNPGTKACVTCLTQLLGTRCVHEYSVFMQSCSNYGFMIQYYVIV